MSGVAQNNQNGRLLPLYSSSDVEVETSTQTSTTTTTKHQKPKWMKCINAVVPPRTTALNEAVSQTANVSLETANELISMGAVWAKMDTLTDDEVLEQYYDNNPSSLTSHLDGVVVMKMMNCITYKNRVMMLLLIIVKKNHWMNILNDKCHYGIEGY